MGLMLLPSLEEKRFIAIDNVSKDEAQKLAEWFTAQVRQNRKVVDRDQVGPLEFYYNMVDKVVENGGAEFLSNLSVSTVPGTRGARILYFDDETDILGVGTTIVYNRNHATVGFQDNTIFDALVNYSYGEDEDLSGIDESQCDYNPCIHCGS